MRLFNGKICLDEIAYVRHNYTFKKLIEVFLSVRTELSFIFN